MIQKLSDLKQQYFIFSPDSVDPLASYFGLNQLG